MKFFIAIWYEPYAHISIPFKCQRMIQHTAVSSHHRGVRWRTRQYLNEIKNAALLVFQCNFVTFKSDLHRRVELYRPQTVHIVRVVTRIIGRGYDSTGLIGMYFTVTWMVEMNRGIFGLKIQCALVLVIIIFTCTIKNDCEWNTPMLYLQKNCGNEINDVRYIHKLLFLWWSLARHKLRTPSSCHSRIFLTVKFQKIAYLIVTYFRDFQFQINAKLKTREKLFLTFFIVLFILITYFWPNRENLVPQNMPVPFSRNKSPRK